MNEASDDESDIQDIDLINSVLQKDKLSTEASSQCSASTSTTATVPSAGLPSGSRIEVALALNKLTEEKLKRLESILITRLAECREKLTETQRVGKEQKTSVKPSTFLYIHCGKPYFKDKHHFPAPDNSDTTIMKSTGIYDIVSVNSVTGWTVKDKRNFIEVILELSRSIKKNQLHSIISQCHRDAKFGVIKEIEKRMATVRCEINLVNSKSLTELALPIEEEYDWEMVAAKLNYRHKPSEYRALWKLFLHPSINKSSWTQREHTKLQNIAIQHNFRDWDKIAEELSTGRTGYQCFVYYRTNMSNKFTSTKWTVEEEEYLKRLIEYYRQDNYIPWGQIVPKMPHRTKLQMYNKYVRMTEKKGRFLPEEDAVLLTCVKKYGTNWKEIANFLNGRSVPQIRMRYQKLNKTQRISCVWTVAEDRRLVQLMANQEAGSYADIADNFPGKDRSNIRSRHLILLRWMKRYPKHDIALAPRRGARRLLHGQAADDLSNALENLKTRMTQQYDASKTSKVTIDSSEESIEHSIVVTLMNENFFDYMDTDGLSTSTNNSDLPNADENIANLRNILLLLKASLNKSRFLESTASVKYKELLKETDSRTRIPIRSYSKKQEAVRVGKTPDLWGEIKLTDTMHVLPPNFSTIIGCKQLLMKYSNKNSGQVAKSVMSKVMMLRRKNPVFKEQFAQLMDRFETLFLWPMLLSNKQPRPLSHYTQIIPSVMRDVRFYNKKRESAALPTEFSGEKNTSNADCRDGDSMVLMEVSKFGNKPLS